jgi:small-conductance mechanosensitive channel
VIFIVTITFKRLLHRQIYKLAQKTSNEWDNLAADLIEQTKLISSFFVAIFLGSLALTLPSTLATIIEKLLILMLLVQGAIWGSYTLKFWSLKYRQQKMKISSAAVTTFIRMGFILRVFLWVIIILLILDNLGVDITALVAGLGITGVAVALAVQNILGDLFGALSIVLDKPFEVGDFIIVDNYLGSIERVGLKTTRLRSLSGEQLIFSNTDLLTSRIRNYKRMYTRRIVFSIGVVYEISYEKLVAIPQMLREIVEAREQVHFDRAHFKSYGPYSLDFEVVYWVQDPDYTLYMNIQQAINLDIFQRFQQEGIEFAYPTQALYVQNAQAAPQPPEKEMVPNLEI